MKIKEEIRQKISNAFDENGSDANDNQMMVITEDNYSDLIDEIMDIIDSDLKAVMPTDEMKEAQRDSLIEVIEELKKMSNNYQVLDGQYVISKNVLDVFIEYIEM